VKDLEAQKVSSAAHAQQKPAPTGTRNFVVSRHIRSAPLGTPAAPQ
jgi:hypothetical protein